VYVGFEDTTSTTNPTELVPFTLTEASGTMGGSAQGIAVKTKYLAKLFAQSPMQTISYSEQFPCFLHFI
jgi:hypothetical protein